MPNESEPKGWWHTLPGILTAVAAVVTAVSGLLVAVKNMDSSRSAAAPAAPVAVQTPTPTPSPTPTPTPTPAQTQAVPAALAPQSHARIDLTGTWRDNFGNVTTFRQEGKSVRLEASGRACAGTPYRSHGSGTVDGNQIRSSYESSIPSTGNCIGTIDDLGMRITSTCTDSVCGTFVSAAAKVR